MGKRTILSFIYDGFLDYNLRIPHSFATAQAYNPDNFSGRYYAKSDYTLRDVINERLILMKDLEQKGLRSSKSINAKKLKEDDADGKYDEIIAKYDMKDKIRNIKI